ncbi:cytochrome P450 monooxygenase [Hyaloscypha finlandica]|nr:cytochrome P450 monooxygenase [Hyaloscypha finlandica]
MYLVSLSVAGLMIIGPLLLTYRVLFTNSGSIKDSKGSRVKELKSDSRLAKFAASLELSDQGKRLAGNDPYLIHNGNSRELVITQPDHIKDFYRNDTKDAVGVKVGERWRAIRKYFDPEFTPAICIKTIPRYSAKISEWVDALPIQASRVSSTDGSFMLNVKIPCRFLPFQLVALQLYGDVFSDELYSKLLEINVLHEVILHDVILNKRLVSKVWNLFPTAAKKRMDLYTKQWESMNLDIIQYARENEVFCPAERIYKGVDQAHDMTKTEFLHTVDEILFANVDISSAVLNTLFTNLAANQEFQRALRAEFYAQKAQGNYDLVRYVTNQDCLLNFLVMESMRLTPAFCNKNIGGYNVPPNTAVVIDTRRLNTDAVTWGPDGNTFRPERFTNMPRRTCQYGFMRFGVGAASGKCLGKNVADIVFKMTTLAVIARYMITNVKKEGVEEAVSPEILFTPV